TTAASGSAAPSLSPTPPSRADGARSALDALPARACEVAGVVEKFLPARCPVARHGDPRPGAVAPDDAADRCRPICRIGISQIAEVGVGGGAQHAAAKEQIVFLDEGDDIVAGVR